MRHKSMLADLGALLHRQPLRNTEVERLIERTIFISDRLVDEQERPWEIVRAGALAIIRDLGVRRPDLFPLVKAQLSGWLHRRDEAAYPGDRTGSNSKAGVISYRAHPRIRVPALYAALRHGAATDYFAPVQDFSRSGAKIQSRLAVSVGNRVLAGQVEAEVVRLIPGGFACRFVDELQCLNSDWARA